MEELKTKLIEFNSSLTAILSKERLESYNGEICKYYENKLFAFKVGNKIADLEIYLRNKLDFCLKFKLGETWIKQEKPLEVFRRKTSLESLDPNQILSSLMLGEVIDLIRTHKIEAYMFDLEAMDFEKYHQSNRNYFFSKKRKKTFNAVAKNRIVLNLIRTIRNRAFHWENLSKVRISNNKVYPRITHQQGGTNIGIAPENILVFLDDLIVSIGNAELVKYKDLEIRYKGLAPATR